MVRSHPVLTACALALLLPSAATAGPIEWEVSAHLARVGAAVGPMAGTLTDEFVGGGSTVHEQTFSRLASTGPQSGWGWKSVRVGSLLPDGPRYDPLHGAPGTFAVNLTLTDRATWQTGTATFAGRGWEELVQDVDNPFRGILLGRRAFAELTGPTEQSLTVGGTEYEVGLRAVDRGGFVDFVADIRAGDIAATPEPTTLALAGIGLGGAALARRPSGLHRAPARG